MTTAANDENEEPEAELTCALPGSDKLWATRVRAQQPPGDHNVDVQKLVPADDVAAQWPADSA